MHRPRDLKVPLTRAQSSSERSRALDVLGCAMEITLREASERGNHPVPSIWKVIDSVPLFR
jgi:hypothetical protein